MVKPISKENNFAYLTTILVFLLFASAVVEEFAGHLGQRIVQISTILTLVVGIWSLKSNYSWFHSKMGTAIALVIILIINIILDLMGLDFLQLFILLGFFIFTTYFAARQVLFSGIIDGNKIIGSICIYLLMGLIWCILYLIILEFEPNAFNGLSAASWYQNFPEVTYFSYVTLTTLGYGDISPILPIARFFVFMEAIVGVFYMAILVASLIGVRMSEHNKHH
ncbi:MAG: potassium channel family protein [Gammaproteobacteria bacterium]